MKKVRIVVVIGKGEVEEVLCELGEDTIMEVAVVNYDNVQHYEVGDLVIVGDEPAVVELIEAEVDRITVCKIFDALNELEGPS